MESPSQQNPFQSPETPVEAMPLAALTPRQRRILEFYLKHQESVPTTGELVWGWLKVWIVPLSVFSVMIFMLYFMNPLSLSSYGATLNYLAIFLVALVLGAFLRDISYLRQTKVVWPLLQEIIDWKKAAARLDV